MAAKPESTPPDKKEAKPKRGKGLLIGAILGILLAAGAGAGWYFTRPVTAADHTEAVAPKRADAVFVPLDAFTVNLADEGGERLAQIAIVLELSGKDAQAALAKNLPVVRSNTLLLLSSQHSKTLLTLDGKFALAAEVARSTGVILGWKDEAAEPALAANPAGLKDAKTAAPAKPEVPSPAKAPLTARRDPRPDPAQPNPVVAVHFSQLLVQ